MRAEFTECEEDFWLSLKADTIEEAAIITRYGINKKKVLKYSAAFVSQDGTFAIDMSFGKIKQPHCEINSSRKLK